MSRFSFILLVAANCLVLLSTYWSVSANAWLTCRKETDPYYATLIKLVPSLHNGSGEMVDIQKTLVEGKRPVLHFLFQKRKFIYSTETGLSLVLIAR